MENSIDSFIKKIFSESPKERNSVKLEFTGVDEINDVKKLNKIIFEELVYILTKGVKILYKKNVDIENVTDNDINILNKYFNSFGFKINLKISNKIDINNLEYLQKLNNNLPNIDENIKINFNDDNLNNLILIIKKKNKKFIINFDFIN